MNTLATVNDIENLLTEMTPPSLALDWDNVGLLLGRRENPVRRMLLALDMTRETVDQAIAFKADILVTHHPAIFHKLSCLTDRDWQQELLLCLAENEIALYSAHTNLDCSSKGVNAVLAKKLKLTKIEELDQVTGLGRIGYVQGCDLFAFTEFLKKTLKVDYLVVGNAGKKVHKVAVCGGAGADLIPLAVEKGADTFVTGDIKYHEAQKAVFSGLNIIDAGHQATELPVLEDWADRISLRLTGKDWNVNVRVASETLLLKHV